MPLFGAKMFSVNYMNCYSNFYKLNYIMYRSEVQNMLYGFLPMKLLMLSQFLECWHSKIHKIMRYIIIIILSGS